MILKPCFEVSNENHRFIVPYTLLSPFKFGGFLKNLTHKFGAQPLVPEPRTFCLDIYIYIYMGVSKNNGTPTASILIGFWNHYKPSILGEKSPYFWFNTHIAFPYSALSRNMVPQTLPTGRCKPLQFWIEPRWEVLQSWLVACGDAVQQQKKQIKWDPILLGQWLNFKLFGITYLVGKISRSNFYFRVHWLSELFLGFWGIKWSNLMANNIIWWFLREFSWIQVALFGFLL